MIPKTGECNPRCGMLTTPEGYSADYMTPVTGLAQVPETGLEYATMETVIAYLVRQLRASGPKQWPGIVESINETLPEDKRIGVSLLRKIAYNDRDNPGVQTVQPLLDYFAARGRGDQAQIESKAAN